MSEDIIRLFEEYADRYDAWFDKRENKPLFEEEVSTLRMLRRGGLSLEVGVGSGRFACQLGIEIGIDLSRKLLMKAKERGVEVILADAHLLPFRNGSFEEVYLIFTICFLRDPASVLREVARVLRSDGYLVIGFIPRSSPLGRLYREKGRRGHPFYRVARFYDPEEVKTLAHKAGFKLESILSSLCGCEGLVVKGWRPNCSFCSMIFTLQRLC